MPEFWELGAEIEALEVRAAAGDRSHELARAIEDLLCDGYAVCLQVDSHIRRLGRRRRELIALGEDDQRRDELRELGERQDSLERWAVEARRSLGDLRERFVRIGGVYAARR